jgi:hypothetical protein
MVLGRFENNIHKHPSSTTENIKTVGSLNVNYCVLAEKCNEKKLKHRFDSFAKRRLDDY